MLGSSWVLSVSASADGRFAASGGSDRSVKVWDMGLRECVHTFAAPDQARQTPSTHAHALTQDYERTERMTSRMHHLQLGRLDGAGT